MKRVVRQRALTKLFGGNFAAAAATSWAIDKIVDIMQEDPDQIDVAQLRPGQQYEVTSRPAMTKSEAKLDSATEALERQRAKLAQPTSRQIRTAKKLNRAERKFGKAREGTGKHLRRYKKLERAEAKFDKRVLSSRRVKKLTSIEKELEETKKAANKRRREAIVQVGGSPDGNLKIARRRIYR